MCTHFPQTHTHPLTLFTYVSLTLPLSLRHDCIAIWSWLFFYSLWTKFYFTIFLEHKIKFTFWVNFIFCYIFICFSEKSKLFPGMKQVFPWDEHWFFYLRTVLFSSLFTLSKQNFILQNYWFFLIKFVFTLKIISYHINFKE